MILMKFMEEGQSQDTHERIRQLGIVSKIVGVVFSIAAVYIFIYPAVIIFILSNSGALKENPALLEAVYFSLQPLIFLAEEFSFYEEFWNWLLDIE